MKSWNKKEMERRQRKGQEKSSKDARFGYSLVLNCSNVSFCIIDGDLTTRHCKNDFQQFEEFAFSQCFKQVLARVKPLNNTCLKYWCLFVSEKPVLCVFSLISFRPRRVLSCSAEERRGCGCRNFQPAGRSRTCRRSQSTRRASRRSSSRCRQ